MHNGRWGPTAMAPQGLERVVALAERRLRSGGRLSRGCDTLDDEVPMPARDIYHRVVVKALVADGWEITDDPLAFSFGGRDLYVDLGAEDMTIGAARSGCKIAVEIKSFLSASVLTDLERALGQHTLYRAVLRELHPDRKLYLAVPARAYDGILSERLGELIVQTEQIALVVFDEQEEKITRWTPSPATAPSSAT